MDRSDRMTVGPQPQRSSATLQARAAGASALADMRPEAAVQRALMQSVQSAPAMVAQRRSLQAAFGPAVQFKDGPVAQRAGPEDELQMKVATGVAQLAGPEDELQMKTAGVAQRAGPEDELQMKVGPGVAQLAGPEDELQMKAAPGVAQLAEGPVRRNDTGMPDDLKSGIESLSGISMDGVQVHYNSPHPTQLNALAYAQGTDIHVAPGQEQHLPHEAWHVVQQAQGRVQATTQMKGGVPVNTDAGLEAEADAMGAIAARGAPAQRRAR